MELIIVILTTGIVFTLLMVTRRKDLIVTPILFNDLVFEPAFYDAPMEKPDKQKQGWNPWGKRAVMWFDNGYAVSVIRKHDSNGGPSGRYEVAAIVEKLTRRNGTSVVITSAIGEFGDEIEGYLTEREVTKRMQLVQALENYNE